MKQINRHTAAAQEPADEEDVIAKLTKSRDYYRETYLAALAELTSLRKRVAAIATLADSLTH